MPCDPKYAHWVHGIVVDTMGNVLTDGGHGYRTHWSTCPTADQHRTRQRHLFGDDQREGSG